MGWLIIGAGVVLVAVGVLVLSGAFAWFGRLPGDIRIGGEGDSMRVFIPITSMLLISVVVTLLLNLVVRRWL